MPVVYGSYHQQSQDGFGINLMEIFGRHSSGEGGDSGAVMMDGWFVGMVRFRWNEETEKTASCLWSQIDFHSFNSLSVGVPVDAVVVIMLLDGQKDEFN